MKAHHMVKRIMLLGAVVVLGGCKPGVPAQPADPGMFAVYNFTGKTVYAPVAQDNAGNHGVHDQEIADQDVSFLGNITAGSRPQSVTLQWIGGPGRARWYTATVPVNVEQAAGSQVEIYLRPDRFVCASLVDSTHASNRGGATGMLARVSQDRRQLACVQPMELPRLKPGMATGFEQDSRSHSWELYDRAGTSTLVNRTLTHKTGRVAFRYGTDLKKQPNFIDEFNSVQSIGNGAAWLVNANLQPAHPGLFVVTGNDAGWQWRYLGDVYGEEDTRIGNRQMMGGRILADPATADFFMLPQFYGVNYYTLGQSPDGRYLAIYWEQDREKIPDRADAKFNVTVLDLENGEEVNPQISGVPALPANGNIYTYYRAWYREHCTWKPQLACNGSH